LSDAAEEASLELCEDRVRRLTPSTTNGDACVIEDDAFREDLGRFVDKETSTAGSSAASLGAPSASSVCPGSEMEASLAEGPSTIETAASLAESPSTIETAASMAEGPSTIETAALMPSCDNKGTGAPVSGVAAAVDLSLALCDARLRLVAAEGDAAESDVARSRLRTRKRSSLKTVDVLAADSSSKMESSREVAAAAADSENLGFRFLDVDGGSAFVESGMGLDGVGAVRKLSSSLVVSNTSFGIGPT
jgi:hypothetical protein